MSEHKSKFQHAEKGLVEMKEVKSPLHVQRRWFPIAVWVPAILVIAAAIILYALPAQQQAAPTPTPTPTPVTVTNTCPDELSGAPAALPSLNKPLVNGLFRVPEIASNGGKLRGTIVLSAEMEWMASRVPTSAPSDNSRSQCAPQYVRIFREYPQTSTPVPGSTPVTVPSGPYSPARDPFPAKGKYVLPRPGPTLRARVGDIVQLTFINEIDTGDFPYSVDRGVTGGCDQSSAGYPGSDKYPDCFHGSSTGNIHFHGTHTNPGSTGDNVLIEVRPLPRDNQGNLTTTPEEVQVGFDKFFADCEKALRGNPLLQWPKTWDDLPGEWTSLQKTLLQASPEDLWNFDASQIAQGVWPQYYIGAVPYCFQLPEWPGKNTSPPPSTSMKMDGDHMAKMRVRSDTPDGRSLIMGQSPGTHWYHAHKHGSTAINVANGMTGIFIIEGQYDDDLNKFYGANWTRDAKVMVINQLGVSPNLMRQSAPGGGPGPGSQDKGPDFSINGRLKPVVEMRPGEVQMWRIANTSGRAGAYFLPPTGFNWKQLAQDGVQFNEANYNDPTNGTRPFLLAAGNRADLLVQAPSCSDKNGCMFPVIVQNQVDPSDLTSAEPITLMSIYVPAGKPVEGNLSKFIPHAPTFPDFLGDISSDEVTGTKKIVFASGAPGGLPTPASHTINGKKFDGNVGEVVLLNKVEEWKLVNNTVGISHPFHIHINPFQVVEVFDPNETITDPDTGKQVPKYVFDKSNAKAPGQCYIDINKPESWRPCDTRKNNNGIWWDVFPIPSARAVTIDSVDNKTVQIPGYFKMRSRFVDYTGQYVIHCHILAHEDRGMMNLVQVVPFVTPYNHH